MQILSIAKGMAAVLGLAAVSSAALAQSDPASLERTIPKFEAKPTAEQPRIAAPSPLEPSESRVAGTFVLGAVTIDGATKFTSAELAETFEPYLASRVGQPELDQIVAKITDRYRRSGYILSYAVLPRQTVQSGIVRVRVVEGYLDEVRIEGDPRLGAAVRAIAARLTRDRPLQASRLERVLGLARDIPGAVIEDARLSRSQADPRRHALHIVVRSDRYRALTYSDNRGTIDGARLRGYASLKAAALVVPGDQIEADLFAIPSDRFHFAYGQLKASLPLNADGLRMALSASRSGQVQRLDGADQHGKSTQWAAYLAYPLVKSRAVSVTANASLSQWRSEEERGGTLVQRDRLQVARLWAEVVRPASIRIDGRLGISRGLDLGAATMTGDALASRPFGSAQFTKVNADLTIAAPLAESVALRLDGSAQLSSNSLLAPEEFALGGSRIGRAYDFNAVTGDQGFGAVAEIAYSLGDLKALRALEIFGYADGGGAFRKRASPGLPKEQWIAGTGIGTRFALLGMFWAGEVGIPLEKFGTQRGIRAFLSVAKAF